MRTLPITFIDATVPAGKPPRPNTADTIDAWLAGSPKPGSCLFVSNQPYAGYQKSVVDTIMSKGFSVEIIGPAAAENLEVAKYLDTIARWMYQENKRLQVQRKIRNV